SPRSFNVLCSCSGWASIVRGSGRSGVSADFAAVPGKTRSLAANSDSMAARNHIRLLGNMSIGTSTASGEKQSRKHERTKSRNPDCAFVLSLFRVFVMSIPYLISNLRDSFGRELSQIVDAEFLLDGGDLVDRLLEALITEEAVLLLVELLAQVLEL